jgi:hypothetical protein
LNVESRAGWFNQNVEARVLYDITYGRNKRPKAEEYIIHIVFVSS